MTYGIAIAKYDSNKNAVKEKRLYTAKNYKELREEFIRLLKENLPVYMFYNDNHNVNILAVTEEYQLEYKKIVD